MPFSMKANLPDLGSVKQMGGPSMGSQRRSTPHLQDGELIKSVRALNLLRTR